MKVPSVSHVKQSVKKGSDWSASVSLALSAECLLAMCKRGRLRSSAPCVCCAEPLHCRRMPKATRDYHPAKHTAATARPRAARRTIEIPKNVEQIDLKISGRTVKLTNLKKLFWPELRISKRDLLQYYAD